MRRILILVALAGGILATPQLSRAQDSEQIAKLAEKLQLLEKKLEIIQKENELLKKENEQLKKDKEPGQTTGSRPEVKKDDIKYEMDQLEKNWGIKFKTAKIEQKKTGGDALVTITLEFSKDVEHRANVGGINDAPLAIVRSLFSGKPTARSAGPSLLQCYFFDEDGVAFTIQPVGKIDGTVSGKEGDAFRVTQTVPGDVLAKTKKISFREEPVKKK
jgi:hypothetical protein